MEIQKYQGMVLMDVTLHSGQEGLVGVVEVQIHRGMAVRGEEVI
jgi:hypothetical protein